MESQKVKLDPDARFDYVNLDKGGFAPGIYVLSVPDGTYQAIVQRLTQPVEPVLHWLQDSRRLVYSSGAGIELVDTGSGRAKPLLAAPPGSL